MLAAIAIILGVFIFYQRAINSITVSEEMKISFSSRYDIWIGSIEMFLIKPLLGWGSLGTLEHGVEFMYRNGNVVHSHNLWLTFLVSGGIIAFLIYFFIKINILNDLKKLYLKYDEFTCILVALNVMVIIQGLVDCSLYAPQLGILFIATNSIVFNLANGVINSNKKVNTDKKVNTVKINKCEDDYIAS